MFTMSWSKLFPFFLMLGFVFSACCGGVCSSSPEKEAERWKDNKKAIATYSKRYKSLKPFLQDDLKDAKSLWKKAEKAEGDKQVSMMQDANIKARSITKKLDKLESKIKKAEKARSKLKKLKKAKDTHRRDEGMRDLDDLLHRVDDNLNSKSPDNRKAALALISTQIDLLDDGIKEGKYAYKEAKGKKVKRKKKKKKKKKGLFSGKKSKKKKKKSKKKKKKGKLLKKLLKRKR